MSWSSVSGQTYQLQRAANEDLNAAVWIDVATVTAVGTVTFHDDATAAVRRFYRVKRVETAAPQGFNASPSYFVPLDGGGRPVEGAVLALGESGALGPFVFRPGGRSALGLGQGFSILFPAGARLVTIDGRRWVSFSEALAQFGAKAPFQLRSPMAVTGGTARLLPVDNLDLNTLLTVFGRSPESGLEVTLFGKFSLRLLGGVFTADGLRGTRAELTDGKLSLPQGTNVYSGLVLDIEPDGGLKLPFSGSFGLDDTTGRGARLTVPPARPLWLELKANGEIALGGRAELAFNPGPQFSVDLLFNDPNYELAVTAKGLRLPLFSALAGLLPLAPEVPDSDVAADLDVAAGRLRHFRQALEHFNSALAADTPAAGGLSEFPLRTAPQPSSVLDAWGHAALLGQALSGAALSGTLTNAGQAASASRDLRSAMAYWLALQRLESAFDQGGLGLDAVARNELREALDEASAAVIARSKSADAVRSMEDILTSLRAWREIHAQRPATESASAADAGRGLEAASAVAAVVNRFAGAFAAELGVVSGVFVPAPGLRLAAVARSEAILHLRAIVELVGLRQQLALETNSPAPVAEAIGQLASRVWTLAAAELTEAERAVDADGFSRALSDAVYLAQLRNAGLIPVHPALAGLPTLAGLSPLYARWRAVQEAEIRASAPVGGGEPVFTPAIVGGTVADKHIPYQAAIVTGGFKPGGMFAEQFCGGSILSDEWILTAAHCLEGITSPNSIGVLVGVTNLNLVGPDNHYVVDRVVVHPFYKATTVAYDYDVALLHLAQPIKFAVLNQGTLRAREIRILSAGKGALGAPAVGTEALVSGWGNTTEGGQRSVELRQLKLPVSERGDWAIGEVTSRMLAAGWTGVPLGDACHGDSGGPLAVGDELVGLVSFGKGCARVGYPSIYTRLSRFEPWINAQTGLAVTDTPEKLLRILEPYRNSLVAESGLLNELGATPVLRLRYDRAEAVLARVVANLDDQSLPDLLAALRLGVIQARLRDLLAGDPMRWYETSHWWEGFFAAPNTVESVLLRIARGAAGKIQAEKDWSAVVPTLDALLAEADYLKTTDRKRDRKTYLQGARILLDAVRVSSSELYQTYLDHTSVGGGVGGGGPTPGRALADMALPGELRVHRVAGAARFNRETRAFSAAFSGELELPGFDLRLAIDNASIASGGTFDLSVHGQVGLPPGNPQGRLIIPAHRPVHVALQPSGQLNFAGAARLELNNGMAFEAFLQLEDPLYRFGLSAQGLRFEVGDKLRVMVPTLPEGRVFATAAARDLNEYFRSLTATLDGAGAGLAGAVSGVREPGQPPEFNVPTAVIDTDAIEAWANGRIADAHLNLTRDYAATLGAVTANLKTLAAALRERRAAITPEELDQRLRVLGRICTANVVRRAAGQNAEADTIENSPEFIEFRRETEEALLALLARASTRDDAYQEATLNLVDRYGRVGTCFDESARSRILAALETFQESLWTAFANTHGISTVSGQIVDASKLPAFEDFAAFRPIFLRFSRLSQQHGLLSLARPSTSWIQQVGQSLAMRWRAALLAQARPFRPEQEPEYGRMGLVFRDQVMLFCAGEKGLFAYPATAIPQLDGPDLPYTYERELRNVFYRRFQAERYVVLTERMSAGHVDKFTTESQPAPNVSPAHFRSIDSLVCRLRTPRDPFSAFVAGVLPPSVREDLQNYRAGSYLLTPCDLTDVATFANLLSRSANAATDRLALYLWNRFTGAAQATLTRLDATEAALRATLREELNDVLKGPSIFDANRFQGIALSARTISLRDRNPTGADMIKLNRWLLEDAFRSQLVESFDPPGTTGEALKVSLANVFNELLQGPVLYTPDRFTGIKLSPETQALLVETPEDKVRALNRRLLEDAYPEELPRADVQVIKPYFPALELLRQPTIDDGNQCGDDYAGADQAEREVIQMADDDFLDGRLTAAETRLLQTGTAGDLQGALKLLKELIWLAGWAEKKQLPVLPRIQAGLGRLTLEFTAAAQARRAWWYLHEYTSILLDASESAWLTGAEGARGLVLAEANRALRTAESLLSSFRLLLPGQRPVDLPLPGSILVERVFGEIQYRRATGQLSGRFGGRVEFPDLQNAYFEITNATLNSDLQFSIQARTAGPLPFNGVSLTAAINASGGRNLPLAFTGAGTVTITNGPAFDAVISWDGTNRTLAFNTQAGNLQSMRFTDNLVLFDAGFGFTVNAGAQAGELRANGSAGFFARGALPANGPLGREQFHLFAENVRASLAYQPGRVELAFSNGTLRLPAFFYPTNLEALCPGQGNATGPSVALNPANPIRATFVDGPTPSIAFQGELNFRQFAIEAPGLPGLAAALCQATLKFSQRELPYLTNVTGSLQIPLPQETNHLDLIDGVFTLTGYPSGRLELREDLTLLNLDGFKFQLLGQGHPECPGGSGLTVLPSGGFNQPPAFQLDGGLKVVAPLSMLTGENGDEVFGLACGSLTVVPQQPPALEIDALQFGGTFHLGSGGPVVRNALVSFEGFQNLFSLDDAHRFIARLEGRLQVPSGPEFILQDARFSFFDPNRPPQFTVAGIGVNNQNFALMNYLPARVTRAELHFRAPQAEVPGLLAPTNVQVLLSAEIKFPASGTPMLAGAVDQLEVEFDANGVPRLKNLDGFELGIAAMKMPPIREIGGRIRIGGLSAGDPERVYLVGRIGGSYQGYTVIGQMAAKLSGPIGFCLDVNAGVAGIPLGPTGILITGASGGESFVNNNGDPCDFTTYFARDPNGNLVAPSAPMPPGLGMTWEAFRDVVERMEAQAQIFGDTVGGGLGGGGLPGAIAIADEPGLSPANNGSTANLPCPGDCPPATVNIFCQPHPDQAQFPGKIIAKFSSIDEPTLNQLGITRQSIQALGGNLAAVATLAARSVRAQVEQLTPPPDPALLGPEVANALASVIASSLDTLELTFANLCRQSLASPQAGETVYDTIRRVAYEGLPCADVTMTVSGNVSYAGISSVAYISGKGILSTSGAGGVIGTVYVMGVPLGQARVFIAATDERGDPNPSICGEALVGFGPIELGTVKVAYSCPGCVTGVLGGIPEMLGALSDPLLRRIASRVQTNSAIANLPRAQLISALLALPTTQRLGIFAELANEPIRSLPANLPQVFFQGIADVYGSVQPQFVACGSVTPKVFGFPLGSSLVEAKLFATKTEVAGGFGFSPSYLFSGILPILPGSDTAALSFSYQITDPMAFVFGGLGGNFAPDRIVAYTQSAIDSMLQNSAFAVSYEIHPLGLTMGAAAGRVILPDLTTHPALPWSNWVRPENRGVANLPSRHDLLLAALATNKLGDAVNWRGTAQDLATIYPPGTPERAALSGMSLAKDYFPHGGVLGAARVTLPAVLTERPPLDKFNLVLNAQAAPIDRLTTAIDLIQNYVLRFNTNGSLGFYLPAPNPPAFYDLNGQLAGQAQLQAIVNASKPQDILESIKSFNVANLHLGQLYPMEQAFLRGYLDGQLLGVPIVRADAVGLPADAGRTEGFLSVTSTIPSGSWLKQFIPQATLIFDARGVPPAPIEQRFRALLTELNAARNTNATDASMRQLADRAMSALTGDLPRMRLTADLQAGLQMPSPVSDLLAFNGAAHLHGFSPRYEPGYNPGDTGPLAQVRREGGLAFQGNLRVKAGGVTLVDIANGEISVVPNDTGLPSLAARLAAPVLPYELLTFRDVLIDFASAPSPRLTAAGRVDPLAIGEFQLVPGAASLFNGRLEVTRTGPGIVDVSARLGPARLTLPSLIAGTDTILIHGATAADPFTFSSQSNWQANLTVSSQLKLGAGGVDLVRLNSADFQSLRFYGSNGLADATMELALKPNLRVTVFPGQSFERTMTLSPAGGGLRVSRDGTFELTGTLGGNFALSGLPITNVTAGAAVRLTQDGLTLTAQAGQFGGGAVAGLPANQASGSIMFGRDGTVALQGLITVNPFSTGQVTVESLQGGVSPISARLENGGLILSGARLVYRTVPLAVLPEITVQNNGNFTVSVGTPVPVTVALGQFSLSNARFTLERTGGVLSVPTFSGTLTIPRLNRSATVSGSLNANGAYSLTGTLSGSTTLSGLPVATLAGNASVTLTENGLTVMGQVSGGTLAQFSVIGAATARLTITPSTLTLSGVLTVAPLNFGVLVVEASAGGNFPIHLVNGAISLSNVQVRAGSLLSAPLALPVFPMSADGSFSVTVTPGAPGNARGIAGFGTSIGSFTLKRQGGVASMDAISATLSVPGFNQTLTGSIRSDGQVALDYAGALAMPGGWGLTGGELHLRNAGLSARGTLSVSGLGALTLDGTITSVGGFTLTQALATQDFYGFPALNAGYTLSALAGQGGTLTVGLQLNLPDLAGARFSGSLAVNGTFSLQALDQSLALGGYGLTDLDLTLSKPGVAAAVLNAAGTLNLPGFGTPINNRLTGTINASGVPNLTWSGALALGGVNLGGGTLALSSGGLAAHGTLGVTGLGTLTFDGKLQPSGAFSLVQGFGGPTFYGFPVQNVVHTLAAVPGSQATISTRLNVNFGDISSLTFEGSLGTSGAAVLRAGALSRNLAGYGMRNVSLLLSNAAGFSSATLAAAADLNVPGFSQRLAGRFTTSGGVEIDWNGALTLGGFNAGNGFLQLRNSGLTAGGSFDVRVAGRSLGTVPFRGTINVNGAYALLPNGSWNLASLVGINSGNSLFNSLGSGAGGSLTLTSTGISGTDRLRYGLGEIPISISSCTPSGISFSGSRSYEDGVRRFADPASPVAICGGPTVGCAELGDVYAGVQSTVSVNANNSAGSFSTSVSGSFAWWVVVDYIGPPPGCTTQEACGSVGGFTVYKTRWCADIRNTFEGIPANQKVSFGPLSLSSDGKFTLNESHGAQTGFDFTLW